MNSFRRPTLRRVLTGFACQRTSAVMLALCVLTITQCALAAEPGNNAAVAAIWPKASELVGLVSNGRIDAMLERVGPIPDRDRLAWDETRTHLINLYGNAGKYSGFDIAGYKELTPRFYEIYILVYFEKHPVLFDFGYYYIDNAWRPQTFRVESDFKAILDTMPLQK